MAKPVEIRSFDDLRRFRLADEGYFVVTDSIGHAIIHKVNSKCIKTDSFNLKVTLDHRKLGSYFWVDSIATAAQKFGASRCKMCRPELHLVPPSSFE
ncbi:MAG: hypothetical protein JRN06_05265 [Nitrososphaerota archaeon]|nr:hypothetical protein [Nitrososphaerota archaeon]MDG7024026.1 hypothetical protein [Nitrososphaerota archaeon]